MSRVVRRRYDDVREVIGPVGEERPGSKGAGEVRVSGLATLLRELAGLGCRSITYHLSHVDDLWMSKAPCQFSL